MAKVDTNMMAVTALGHESVRWRFQRRWITYPVPIRAMSGDADLRDTSVHPMRDGMTVGIDCSVTHCGSTRYDER